MYYPRILVLVFIAMVLASSCKKDDDGDGPLGTTCTETREFWLDGSVGTQAFVTSEPCGNLRLSEVQVGQVYEPRDFGGKYLFTFTSTQNVADSLGAVQGKFDISVGILVSPAIIDTSINGTDTTLTVSPNNICDVMLLGTHYNYLNQAQTNNSNGFKFEYADIDGKVWKATQLQTDSSFVVTSDDGIVSVNPFSGAFLPYCTVKFSYNTLLTEFQGTDTLRVIGTGRLGFR